VESGYCVVFGVSDLSDKMLSMASSSACRVAYYRYGPVDGEAINYDRSYIAQLICSVSCFCYQFSVSYEYTTDGNFAGG